MLQRKVDSVRPSRAFLIFRQRGNIFLSDRSIHYVYNHLYLYFTFSTEELESAVGVADTGAQEDDEEDFDF